ncbi:recombinase family protein [Alkalihalophilus pseudofirmus]|uniref:Recombinase family protein n=1 Tax=Alkalihalophilus pseudofirmus TaxID=79885 RepID=A0AAJ2NQ37_ALKPS|nr:recombinase family protein [Alkalihalophilus pseudofirmus]MDV2886376.1 recombinase family protein [Alkalihalophilus pseudofirmus]
MNPIKVAVGYVRSSGRVNPKSSIPNQIKSIKRYCEENEVFLREIYIDECKSGTKIHGRIAYHKLKEDLRVFKDIEMVLVAFADRLGRESFEFIQTVEEIKGNQIELYCISEGLSSEKMSPFELVMTAVQSEMENKQRYRRINESKEEKMRKGIFLLSKPPLGYELNEERRLVLNDKKMSLVQEIFNCFLEVKSFNKTARIINERLEKEEFTARKIEALISNKTYTGYIFIYSQGGYKQLSFEKHPQIISLETFNRCMDIIKSKEKKNVSTYFYLLNKGLLTCPECSGDIVGLNKKYKCKSCAWHKNSQELDQQFIDFLSKYEKEFIQNKESDKYSYLLKQKEDVGVQFATGQISVGKFSARVNDLQNQIKLLRLNGMNNHRRYTPLLKSGDREMLKKAFLADKIKISITNSLNNTFVLKKEEKR